MLPLLLLLVFVASRLAFRLAKGSGFDAVAFVDLNMAVLLLSAIWSHLSPPGSAARRWASLAMLVASSSLTFGVVWLGVGPPTPEAVLWCFAAFGVAGLICFHLYLAQVAQ